MALVFSSSGRKLSSIQCHVGKLSSAIFFYSSFFLDVLFRFFTSLFVILNVLFNLLGFRILVPHKRNFKMRGTYRIVEPIEYREKRVKRALRGEHNSSPTRALRRFWTSSKPGNEDWATPAHIFTNNNSSSAWFSFYKGKG